MGQFKTVTLPGGVILELILIPLSSEPSKTGGPADGDGRRSGGQPQGVHIARPFMLGATEVTQAQWNTIMDNNPSVFNGGNLPVERITWSEAVGFCEKLTARAAEHLPDGFAFTLPTEAQWEYACRAGGSGKYPAWRIGGVAWYYKNSGGRTHAVAAKKPNAFGLYDMHGNVFEWSLDSHGGYSAGKQTGPAAASSGAFRVICGSSWGTPASDCLPDLRVFKKPDFRANDLGFRVALVYNGTDSDSPPPAPPPDIISPGQQPH
ncbi:MAG: formylglycine-generating enzyme family protein [Opitutaceae bacterium]|nr:formylglycine-generating enzyme family protein [Opitutaceae bacterium]